MIRTSVRAAVVIPLLLVACRTAAPTRPPDEDLVKHVAAAGVVYVPFSPTMVVVRGGEPFVLLHAIVLRAGEQSAAALDVAFMASLDASGARAEDATGRATSSSALLLEAFGPLLPRELRDADVTAIFGMPGKPGVGITSHLVRDGARWVSSEPGTLNSVLVPPLPNQVARPAAGERAAVEAARTFLERADEGDGEGAWRLTSAVVKATTSRRAFEEALSLSRRDAPQSSRPERFHQYDVHTGDFKLGDLVLVCFGSEVGLETVHVRLDDDQEWRVVDFARPSAGVERRGPGAPTTSSQSAARVSRSRRAAVVAS